MVGFHKKSHTNLPTYTMSIDTCVAHAIHKNLDVIEALPEIQDLPLEQLECYVERFVSQMHMVLSETIKLKGEDYLRAKDAAGLCAACLDAGVSLPPRMLLRMCQTIIQLNTLDAQFILDNDEGASLYYVKMSLA